MKEEPNQEHDGKMDDYNELASKGQEDNNNSTDHNTADDVSSDEEKGTGKMLSWVWRSKHTSV